MLPGEQREQNRHQQLGSLHLLLVLQQLQDQSDSLPRHSAPLWSRVAALLRFPGHTAAVHTDHSSWTRHTFRLCFWKTVAQLKAEMLEIVGIRPETIRRNSDLFSVNVLIRACSRTDVEQLTV